MRPSIYCIVLLSILSVSLAWTDVELQEVFDSFNENYGYSFKAGEEYNTAFDNFKTNLQNAASQSGNGVEFDITPWDYMSNAEQIAMLTTVIPQAAVAATALTEGAIAGIVVGCVGAAGLAVGGVFLGLHLKKKKEEEKNEGSTEMTATTGTAATTKANKGVDIYPGAEGRHQSITARAPAIKKTPQ